MHEGGMDGIQNILAVYAKYVAPPTKSVAAKMLEREQ